MSFEEEKDVSEELKEAQEVTADTAETKGKKHIRGPKEGPMPVKPKEKKKDKDSGYEKAKDYVEGVIGEAKKVTWPDRDEVLKWSVIVLCAVSFFTLFTFLVDNFIASPIVTAVAGFAAGEGFGRKAIMLTVLFFASGLGTAAGVMLHAGGDQSGISDGLAMNITGGSGVAERNLDRITVVLALLFIVSIVLMMLWFPVGTIVSGA